MTENAGTGRDSGDGFLSTAVRTCVTEGRGKGIVLPLFRRPLAAHQEHLEKVLAAIKANGERSVPTFLEDEPLVWSAAGEEYPSRWSPTKSAQTPHLRSTRKPSEGIEKPEALRLSRAFGTAGLTR